MDVLLVFLALMFAAVATMPVWNYSAKWSLLPSGACCGVAMMGAMLVVIGII
jgi:hypothetical protein